VIEQTSVAGRPRQVQTVLGLMIAVVVADQTTKYWGWRNAPHAIINAGSTWAVGPVSGWYSGSLTGPLMDVVSCGLLTVAVIALVRRRRPPVVLVSGALVIAGWSSNLLDRLGMHRVNAPGSARGAIDFIPVGRDLYNVADVVIFVSTTVFLVAVCALGPLGRRAVGVVRQRYPITSIAGPAGWRPAPQAARAQATVSAATCVGTPIGAIAAEL
jgi:lipoprotein signal peptidase